MRTLSHIGVHIKIYRPLDRGGQSNGWCYTGMLDVVLVLHWKKSLFRCTLETFVKSESVTLILSLLFVCKVGCSIIWDSPSLFKSPNYLEIFPHKPQLHYHDGLDFVIFWSWGGPEKMFMHGPPTKWCSNYYDTHAKSV